ncbi:MAG: CHAT domain-containing protein [Chloroflexaceae bacterium]|nr:CHAT domain-containing protein [Chloroflexaceae bacterium]
MIQQPSTLSYADLEIGLHRRANARYSVEMSFSQPDSDTDIRLHRNEPVLFSIDLNQLARLQGDPAEYGRVLGASLFTEAVTTVYTQALSVVQSREMGLRVRLLIGPSAPELHSLRWETLREPQNGNLLLTNEGTVLSRYLSSQDWRPVRLRSREQLRALVVVANPADLADYQPGGQTLAPFDTQKELARTSFEDISVQVLTEQGTVTLNTIAAHLRDGYDILYLAAHGALVNNEPYLWMENEAGLAAVIPASELVTRIRELRQPPRLIVLASCQSAGTGNDYGPSRNEALLALGPQLAGAGVPAVVAMQGNIAVKTVDQFLPAFFAELQRDGQIDRAMAAARGAIRTENDWWMPVLFMRLKSGRLWYVPGFGGDSNDFEKWPALVRNIQRGNATPIIGPHLNTHALTPLADIARQWADDYHFPLAPYQREDLAQVAQFLSVSQDFQFPREELLEKLRTDLITRYEHLLTNGLDEAAMLHELMEAVNSYNRSHNPNDPYKILAELPIPIYITADFSTALSEALRAAGKDPQIEICRWHADLEQLPSIYTDDPRYQPSVEQPLIYHLFGVIDELIRW